MFYLIESDGFNSPSIMEFRNARSAERYLMRSNGALGAGDPMYEGFFEESREWYDANGVQWTGEETLGVIDMKDWEDRHGS